MLRVSGDLGVIASQVPKLSLINGDSESPFLTEEQMGESVHNTYHSSSDMQMFSDC